MKRLRVRDCVDASSAGGFASPSPPRAGGRQRENEREQGSEPKPCGDPVPGERRGVLWLHRHVPILSELGGGHRTARATLNSGTIAIAKPDDYGGTSPPRPARLGKNIAEHAHRENASTDRITVGPLERSHPIIGRLVSVGTGMPEQAQRLPGV